MGRCVRCGAVGTVQRDHRQNRMRGNTVASNLQALCPRCHQFKSEHPMLATEEGWSVPRWGVPSSWPAQRMVCGPHGLHLVWVLYDDLGGCARSTRPRRDG
ncbi:HNH endonuclease [Cryobacterium sp. GrIS_2_6]|uniref:HNH endonuclease n=1 Tax=Cryobacterium sp. GrIS_2_6 TaxID=3162785 RepID=UPI0034DCD11F